MTSDQLKLILDLSLGKISKDKFLIFFPESSGINAEYISNALEDAFSRKDSNEVEHILLLGFHFGFFERCTDVLCKLLLEDWHTQHENIALILKNLKCPSTVDCLFHAALIAFPYLDYDESYAFGVKCLYALRAIGTDSAKEKLALLAQVENEIIAENAARLLKTMES
ncbi:hypothetical protein LPB67_07850 [Undibacterium sp. Jales W-56]|uniref:hypothetical protein n=1 Tax=Undibacterium sp. Jales W-56 TaxID=2897325 RepID=UPI0021CF7469|nr:hypothetical protein [Undibacterium sp. Jales W-56]MCU6433691.1 hypothetical protein [Undibacterium sp. Jales W-56]